MTFSLRLATVCSQLGGVKLLKRTAEWSETASVAFGVQEASAVCVVPLSFADRIAL